MNVPLLPVPPTVVTAMAPDRAAVGTVVLIWFADVTVKLVALTSPNVTAVAPLKPVPVIVTEVLLCRRSG